MKIEIEKNDFILTVNVSLSPRRSTAEMISCDTVTILEWLKLNHPNYEVETIIQKPTVSLHNSLGLDRLEGKWLFNLVKPKEVKTATSKKAAKKKTIRKKAAKSTAKPKTHLPAKTTNLEE
jgi:hypothetical protein